MNKNIQLSAIVNFCALLMVELNLSACKALDKTKKTFSLSKEDTSTVAKCIVDKVLHLSYDCSPGGVNFLDDEGKQVRADYTALLNICYDCKKCISSNETLSSTVEPSLDGCDPNLVLEVIQDYFENFRN